MQTSAELGALAEALAKAQGQMTAALKDADNPFFRTRYADLASVWEACRGPLSSNGLSVIQFPTTAYQGEPQPYEWTARSGEVRHGVRIACIVSVLTRLLHSSGQWAEDTVSTMLPTGDPQAVGSAITYLRRYALQSVAGVAPDDDDAEAAHGREPQHKPLGQTHAERIAAQTAQPTAQAAPGTTTVTDIKEKKGKTGTKAWTRYSVTFADGRTATTFSGSLATELAVAQAAKTPVNPDIVDNGKGLDLKGLLPIVLQVESTHATEKQHPDEAVDGPEKVLTVRRIETDKGTRWAIQTDKRQLITDVEQHALDAVAARDAKLGIVPSFEVISAGLGKTANKLTSFVVEVAEPGSEG